MYKISVHQRIRQIISLLHFIGLWHDDNCSKFRKLASNMWFLGTEFTFVLSLIGGSITSEDEADHIFLGNMAIVVSVVLFRLHYFLRKKEEILEFIHKFGAYSTNNSKIFDEINKKVNNFVKFASIFMTLLAVTDLLNLVLPPFFSNDKRLPLNVYTYFNWKESEFIFSMAYVIVTYNSIMAFVYVLFTLITWYLMMSCATTYQILGNELMEMGSVDDVQMKLEKRKISLAEKQKLFFEELIAKIKYHQTLKE